MICPNCGKAARQVQDPSGNNLFYCPACGWGIDRAHQAAGPGSNLRRADPSAGDEPDAPEGEGGASLTFKLLALWLASLVIVLGPYFLIFLYMSWAPPKWVHPTYWLCMLTYLAASATITPRYDDTNLGLWGTLVDNPFSTEDDFNRAMQSLSLFLFPGKVVCFAVLFTWRTLRNA